MIHFTRKVLSVFFIFLISISAFSGCSQSGTRDSSKYDKDNTLQAEDENFVSGVVLSEDDIEFELSPLRGDVQITQQAVITNTKQIVVSVDRIQNGTEIELFLYTDESSDDPVGYAVLSEGKEEAAFVNLTSHTAYKVGAINNTSSSVTLKISS